jgi:hypothetical protein
MMGSKGDRLDLRPHGRGLLRARLALFRDLPATRLSDRPGALGPHRQHRSQRHALTWDFRPARVGEETARACAPAQLF